MSNAETDKYLAMLATNRSMTIAHGFTCPKCSTLSARAIWRPECDACGHIEPAHCCVCRSEQVVALCPEHGYRCVGHAKTHAFCNKLVPYDVSSP